MHAEIEIIIKSGSMLENAATTIGIKMPNVPHEVPVEKASPTPTKKIIAGIKFIKPAALPEMRLATKTFAPSVSVTPFKLQANTRINIAGTIALKPSGKHSRHLRNFKTRRPIYQITVTASVQKLPMTIILIKNKEKKIFIIYLIIKLLLCLINIMQIKQKKKQI